MLIDWDTRHAESSDTEQKSSLQKPHLIFLSEMLPAHVMLGEKKFWWIGPILFALDIWSYHTKVNTQHMVYCHLNNQGLTNITFTSHLFLKGQEWFLVLCHFSLAIPKAIRSELGTIDNVVGVKRKMCVKRHVSARWY